MSYDKYFAKRDKINMERRLESREARQKRLYNKRLSYFHCLSKLTDDERNEKQKAARERTARWRNEANNDQKEIRNDKRREYMRKRRYYYQSKQSERERRICHFDTAKELKLLPAESQLDSDTGHEPFITYLIRNNLFSSYRMHIRCIV